MGQVTVELADEYERIRSRAREDPGTAGDEGEENWASLLRQWLPPAYHVVTKGRLLAHDGSASHQADIIVLRPAYPPFLRDKKHYLVGGVAAAFECKTTLRAEHLTTATLRCKEIKQLSIDNTLVGTPWKELRGGVIYGILAHSHQWQRPGATPQDNVTTRLRAGLDALDHPRELVDIVCVADLGTWHSLAILHTPSMFGVQWPRVRNSRGYPDKGGVEGLFVEQKPFDGDVDVLPAPVGVALATLYERLGQEDRSVRPIAHYFRMTDLFGPGAGTGRVWPLTVFSDGLARALQGGRVEGVDRGPWGEWAPLL
jgi:hypothetical protein